MNPTGLGKKHLFSGQLAHLSGYLLVPLFYVIAAAVISLAGDFPLNDDWTYGLGVQEFLRSGRVYLPGACAAGVFHIIWGALFCASLGFSFETLRLASLVIMVFGACSLLFGLRTLKVRQGPALMLTLAYAANPLMVNITFSFMSDTTALSLATASLSFYLKALRTLSIRWFFASALTLAAAVTVRQTAIVLVPLFLLWPFWCSRKSQASTNLQSHSLRSALAATLGASLIFALAWWGADKWLAANSAVSPFMVSAFSYTRDLHLEFLRRCVSRPGEQILTAISAVGQVLCYAGLALFPFWLGLCRSLLRPSPFWRWPRPQLISAILSFATTMTGAALTVFREHRLMPFSENIWRVTSVGALGIIGIANASPTVRQKKLITTIAYVSAWFVGKILFDCLGLARALFSRGRSYYSASVMGSLLVALLCTVAFAGLETLVRSSDRYYLLFLAPLMLVLGYTQRFFRLRLCGIATAFLLVVYIVYSLFAAQDYLSANRARWQVLAELERSGVSWRSIDGGAEFDVMRDISIYGSPNRGEAPRSDWRWWPISGEEFIVSFSPIPGYEIKSSAEYFSLLTMSKHPVYVLKKLPATGGR